MNFPLKTVLIMQYETTLFNNLNLFDDHSHQYF